MRKVKRITCIMLAVFTIISAPLTSYMEAQAGELVLDIPFIEQLLIMFGINAGLGEQHDYWKRQSELKELFEAAAEGGTAELEGYGTVNFSETESLKEWFEWSLDCQKFLLGNLSVVNPANAARYMEVGKALDEVSYKNSGTCATNALNDSISGVYEEYKIDPQKVLENIQETAKMICSPDTEITDISDAEARAEFNRKFWGNFCAIAAAGMLGVGNAAVPFSALKMYSDSEFNEYDAAFEESGFLPGQSLPVYDNSDDTDCSGRYLVASCYDTSFSPARVCYYTISSQADGFFIYQYNNCNSFYRYVNSLCSPAYVQLSYPNPVRYSHRSVSLMSNIDGTFNVPVFTSLDDAKNYFETGDASGILNLSDAYRKFKQNTGTAGAVIGNPLSGYVGSLKSLTNLIDIIPEIREASDTYGGTAEMLPEIARILSEAGDIAVDNPDADDPNKSSSYSGILAKILAAINKLPSAILSAFAGKFMTAERLETLLNGIPVVLAGVLSDAFSDSQISILPGILSDALSAAFPDAASAIKALIDLPAYIVSAVSGIQVKVPEITIPDIVIPEIVIPEIAIPDVFVEAPAVTLNPTFDITVANDYAGLDNVISKAVEGVMTDVFIPNETATLEKVGEMQEYFEFKDDVIKAVDDLKTMLFGITPSPILKIPIGKTTSKKYNYGTGNYIIIDVSWYAPYKQFGDKVILAIAWALFLWRLFLKLPGIISGTEGSIMAADRSYQKYLSGKD